MPALRKIPLVWSSPKEKQQINTRFDPTIGRVVNIACVCIPPPPPPEVCAPPEFVTLSISGSDLVITFPDGVLMFQYDADLIRVIDDVDLGTLVSNVNVGGTYTVPNGVSLLTSGLQYKILLQCTGLGDPACNFGVYSNIITGPVDPCPKPDPVDSVVLSNITHGSGDISWIYSGIELVFQVNIYEGDSLPVNTNSTPVAVFGGYITSPYTINFSPITNYYYVASVRVKNDCGYSIYIYSEPIQAP